MSGSNESLQEYDNLLLAFVRFVVQRYEIADRWFRRRHGCPRNQRWIFILEVMEDRAPAREVTSKLPLTSQAHYLPASAIAVIVLEVLS